MSDQYPPPPPGQPGPPGPPPGYPPYQSYPPGYPPAGPPEKGRPVAAIVVAVVVAVLVIGGAAIAALVTSGDDDEPSAGGGDRSGDTSSTAPVEANLDDVEVYEDLSPDHVTGDVEYEQSPPVGGPHHQEWLDCGVYDEPVPEENVVHDLEHGTVWITYDPDAVDAEGVDQLAAVLPDNGILSPYPGLSSPVVLTVWGRQLGVTGPDDPRIALFVEEFEGGETSPEPFASCVGGLDPEQLSSDF